MVGTLLGVLRFLETSFKDAPAFITAVSNRLGRREREQAIRDLRLLHFSPEFRKLLSQAASANYVSNPAALRRLHETLMATADPIGLAIDRLNQFVGWDADLPWEEFATLAAHLDAKRGIRYEIAQRLDKFVTEGAIIEQASLEDIQERIQQINIAIGRVHETIRLLGALESQEK